MKFLRPVLIGCAVLAVLLTVAVLLAFTPAVQTWAVRRVLAAQPGLQAEVGRVEAGLKSVRLEAVRLRQPGLDLVLPAAEIELPVVSALRKRIYVNRIVAKGWTLDLSAPAVTAAGPAPVPPTAAGYLAVLAAARAQPAPAEAARFSGIFSQLELPFDLSLAAADLAGEVLLPRGPGRSPARAKVAITGGGLAPGAQGRFVVSAEIAVDDSGSPVNHIQSRQELLAHMDGPRSFDRLELSGVATAAGPQLPNGARIDAAVSASRMGGGENYAFSFRSGNRLLADVRGELPAQAEGLNGTWKLDARSEDLAPFALGRPLPTFAANGEGSFALDRDFRQVQAAGRIVADLSRLELIEPRLRPLGTVRVEAGFDVVSHDDGVRLSRLEVDLAGERPVAGLVALQGVEFNRATGELRVADPASDLLRLSLHGLPLAWAQPFADGVVFSGGDLRGEFTASVREGRFVLRSAAPLAADRLALALEDRPLAEGLDFAADVSLDYAPQGWQAEIAGLVLRRGGVALLQADLKAAQPAGDREPLKATGTYALDLPAVLAQPAASGYAFLTGGRARGHFAVSLGSTDEVGAALELAGLAAGPEASLPDLRLEVRADRHADGRLDVRLPVTVTGNGRQSDLVLTAALQPATTGLAVNATLTGGQIYLEDLRALTAVIPDAPAAAPSTTPAGPAGPVWGGIEGRLTLDLKQVVYSSTVIVHDVAGTVHLGPEALTFENLTAGLGDGAGLRLGGGLGYNPALSRAYALKADVSLTHFDPVPLFRTMNPATVPPIEGRFDAATQLSAQAAGLAGLAEVATGTIRLSSRGGTLRALSVDVSEFARNGSRIGSVAGLIGLATGDTRALKYADRLKAASDLAQQLTAISFDQFNVELERSSENDYVVKDLSLISPTLRILGAGRIRHQPGLPVWHQPLALQLQLGARDRLAENLRVLKLLGEQNDALGYAPLLETLTLDGTLAAVGTSKFRDLLARALAGL